MSVLLAAPGVGHLPVASAGEREISAAVARGVRAADYEVTERRAGHDGEVVPPVTDGAYTLYDDKGRDKMLDALAKAKGT